eukprot:4508710-Prymnesium_polylepis.1
MRRRPLRVLAVSLPAAERARGAGRHRAVRAALPAQPRRAGKRAAPLDPTVTCRRFSLPPSHAAASRSHRH